MKATICAACHRVVWAADVNAQGLCVNCQEAPKTPKAKRLVQTASERPDPDAVTD